MRQLLPGRLVRHRSFSSAEIKLPLPTWSLGDLNLTSPTNFVSDEELEKLGRRCLIDVNRIDGRDTLKRDLSNMMHCLEHVKNIDLPEMTPNEIYDVPRGVKACPPAAEATEAQREEAKRVWENMLQPNTTRRGGHEYFSVVTKVNKK
uniref:Uncharacterized protein n=1 Tax=Cyclophora tenuis TaxID=216820 RepID=A0A7S1CZK4_CYCTE|mmetsp:Transcript_16260/g.27548  ORF Transcript_16260/g.27548 Transcript_16260/m.27548 type:complete len:148 (+) Transcript_16260:374-817(+)